MVIISNSDYAHIIVCLHHGTNEIKFIGIHVLRLVNDQYAFYNFTLLNFSIFDHLGSIFYYVINSF